MVYLPQTKSWDTGCSLHYPSLPLIIPLRFHSHVACPLLLFSHLFPNASLVTRRKQKQRRWFIQTKTDFELPSVPHLFWNRAGETASPKQSLLNQCIPSLPPQCYPLFFWRQGDSGCKKHQRWWFFCHSEAKESLWLGWMQGGKFNSLLLTASSLNLRCLLISCIPVEKSRLKTQVVKTSLVFSTNAGGSVAVLSRSRVELAFRRSLFPI